MSEIGAPSQNQFLMRRLESNRSGIEWGSGKIALPKADDQIGEKEEPDVDRCDRHVRIAGARAVLVKTFGVPRRTHSGQPHTIIPPARVGCNTVRYVCCIGDAQSEVPLRKWTRHMRPVRSSRHRRGQGKEDEERDQAIHLLPLRPIHAERSSSGSHSRRSLGGAGARLVWGNGAPFRAGQIMVGHGPP